MRYSIARAVGTLDLVAFGLVHGNDVGKLEQAELDPWSSSPAPGIASSTTNTSTILATRLGLADTHSLDENHVVARGFAERHGLSRGLGHAAQTIAGGEGRMKAFSSAASRPDPRLVAEDRPAGPRRGRIDGEHGNLAAAARPVDAQRVDERGVDLPEPGTPLMPTPMDFPVKGRSASSSPSARA